MGLEVAVLEISCLVLSFESFAVEEEDGNSGVFSSKIEEETGRESEMDGTAAVSFAVSISVPVSWVELAILSFSIWAIL